MATSINGSQVSPYHDQPLGSGEIRLLTVESEVVPLQHVFPWLSLDYPLRLTTTRHKLAEKPGYFALSYVWGAAPASISLSCNGRPLLVTSTAYEMLREVRRSGRVVWVDAVCIDQSNEDEKASQIPLMRQIYANATWVAVWLGIGNVPMNAFMREYPRLLGLSKTWTPRNITSDPGWRGEEWPKDEDIIWEGLMWIMDHEWFRRVWTFQELVLADQAVIVCGGKWINALSFIEFVETGMYQPEGYLYYDLKLVPRLPSKPKPVDLSYFACCIINNSRKNPLFEDYEYGNQQRHLPHLLHGMRTRNVKEPVDRIWGIAGILSKELQERLAPMIDYSAQGRANYQKTYLNFFKAAITTGKNLSPLVLPPVLEGNCASLPSWCPNLTGQPMCTLHLQGHWNLPLTHVFARHAKIHYEEDDVERAKARAKAITSHPLKSITITDDDNVLHARGFVVDEITQVIQDPDAAGQILYRDESGQSVWSIENPRHVAAIKWLEDSLRLARTVYPCSDDEIPEEFLMCLLVDWRITSEAERVYRDCIKCMTTGRAMYHQSLPAIHRRQAWELNGVLVYLIGHVFFATKGGRIGLAQPGCKPGDKVCAVYGGQQLYNLRRKEGGGEVTFHGLAFIPYLMEQHQRDEARLSEDEMFHIF